MDTAKALVGLKRVGFKSTMVMFKSGDDSAKVAQSMPSCSCFPFQYESWL
jgi:hypothetical protein